MKKEDLFQAIGECDEKLLSGSEQNRKKKNRNFQRKIIGLVAIAAVLGAVCFYINQMGLLTKQEQYDTAKENEEDTGNDFAQGNEEKAVITRDDKESGKVIDATMGGGEGETEDDYLTEDKEFYGLNPEYEYCSYYSGVVLPLTLEQENEEISATRNINFDFKKFDSFENEGNVVITDTYTLQNTSDEQQVIRVKYPLELSLKELNESMLAVTLNGQALSTALEAGRYYGTNEFGDYSYLGKCAPQEYTFKLKDDKTLIQNMDDSILDEKVIVYEYQCAEDVKDGCYTVQMWAENKGNYTRYIKTIDNPNVYYVNMNSYHLEENTEYYGFLTEEVKKTGRIPRMIFFGSEPKEYKEQGYTGLIYSEETKMNDLQVKMVRYESTFREVLAMLVEEEMERLENENQGLQISNELYNWIAGAVLADVVKDNSDGVDDYDDSFFAAGWENNISGLVELMYDFRCEYYITHEITIPAGETVTYEIQYEREGSHDYTAAEQEYLGNYGYDNMPYFGTNLNFVRQNATIDDHDYICILNQNYGFDLESGIKEVVLSPDMDYYYMVVRRLKQ